jgi:hypothetical protein
MGVLSKKCGEATERLLVIQYLGRLCKTADIRGISVHAWTALFSGVHLYTLEALAPSN